MEKCPADGKDMDSDLQIVNDFLIMRNRVLNIVFVFINKMVFKDCSG